MAQIPSLNDTIYVVCVIRRNKETKALQYVPIVNLGEDLKSYTIAASSDLLGVQLKNQQKMVELASIGSPVVTIPVSVDKFKKITAAVESNLTETVNIYLDACREYDSVLGILGNDGNQKNLKYYLYATVVTSQPPCVLSSDFEICKPEALDIIACLGEAARISEDNSDGVILSAIETLTYAYEDFDEDSEDDNFGNFYD